MTPGNKDATRSRTAVIITSLYLLTVAASLIIMWMTADETAMSGIFLVLFTLPWAPVLTWIQDALQLDSLPASGLLLAAGGMLNGFILYRFISFITGRSKQ